MHSKTDKSVRSTKEAHYGRTDTLVFNLAMKNDRERRRKPKHSRVRPSQPPGRFVGVHLWARRTEYDEVKGISPESETKPRKVLKPEMPIPYKRAQATRPRTKRGEFLVWSPGVADSIESCEGCGSSRRREELLGAERPENLLATTSGSGREGSLSGRGDGLAMKRGNARGVKAPTKQSPWKGKHQRYTANGKT